MTEDGQSSPASGIEAFWELERFLEGAARARLGLSEIERESAQRGRELVRLTLQAHIDARGDGDVGCAIAVGCPDGPVRLAYKRRHTRLLLTLFGQVRITRVGYGAPGRGDPPARPTAEAAGPDLQLRVP